MPRFRKIFCPVDFSEHSMRAYQLALSVASHYGARLLVQHVVELWRYPCADFAPSPELMEGFYRTLRERGEEKLQQLVQTCAYNEVRTESVVQGKSAPDYILAFAEDQNVDLIVMGTHGRRGFNKLMLGSVTERVMRNASCPVLTVNKRSHDFIGSDQRLGPVHLSRVLFCTDLSESSRQALDHAISLTTEYEAELTLMHVLEDTPAPPKVHDAVATAIERLDGLIPPETHKAGKVETKTTVRIGKPYQQIIQLAMEAQTDLVIMAVRGRGTLDLAVFGSTTYRVIQFGPCPVLVVST
ncbi:MAG TPA: universal stress protein [Methylomirabilota bacterium]|nr:universal stress protein [Methylomirabilota bacterium]